MKPALKLALLICITLATWWALPVQVSAASNYVIEINLKYDDQPQAAGHEDFGHWKFKWQNRKVPREGFGVHQGDTVTWTNSVGPPGQHHCGFSVVVSQKDFDGLVNPKPVDGTLDLVSVQATTYSDGWAVSAIPKTTGLVRYALVAETSKSPPTNSLSPNRKILAHPFPGWETVYVPASLDVSQSSVHKEKP